ncbi:hypothetical protein OCK74_24630 [Chitinophagaceae bacterium LB-8]|uniref:Uncharacterized protein n=1 Tax=Paraflavisolibacter caeni TaxID=2982496 RepID=A0A9X2XQ09_9BACT|nr:hypothetical protein [Paraflavisolibacter caeni]MCU7552329.1 hypothetical protein [Paraflavisolibacter caeni]
MELSGLVLIMVVFRKMEVQEFKLHPVAGDIIKFTKDISYSFSDISEKKNINFSFESNVDALEINFDKDKLERYYSISFPMLISILMIMELSMFG